MTKRQIPQPPVPSRRALWAALALSAAGLAVSLLLVWIHAKAHAGGSGICLDTATVSCDRVATSRFSVALGIPLAAWGAAAYVAMGVLAAAALRRGARGTSPAGLLFLLALAASCGAVALAGVSKLAIGAWCPPCAVSWAISFALLAASARACRGVGVGAAIRADLRLAARHPLATAAVLALACAAVVGGRAAYPRYWESPAGSNAPLAGDVVEYSDYQCPFCAKVHEQARALRATTPGLRIVRRHFPLDSSCNPLVPTRMHPAACGLARAGICAEAQGRFTDMDDALFRNQERREPVEAIAQRVGLDLDRFRACLGSKETEDRLAADLESARRDGIRATPSYVVGGKVYEGNLPVELLGRGLAAEGSRR